MLWGAFRREEGPTIESELESLREQLLRQHGPRVELDVPMARFTSLRVGGPADVLVRPESREELGEVLAVAAARPPPLHVVGGGFNTIVRDGGIRGLVVHPGALRGVRLSEDGSVEAEAGATHATVTRVCADHGRAGLEFAVGIPGTVGGWIVMNAGIPEREMKDVVESVEVLLPEGRGPLELHRDELRFRYRALDLPRGAIVVSARFRTSPDDPTEVRERMRTQLEHRRRTQPVDRLTCGSVFKNPEGDHAGRLLEAADLKGARVGDAEISAVHANFIVNRGRATASDVLRLIDRAHSEVLDRFGVDLELEVHVLGEES
jgi:UDP-N-acetylmuramate dehydrogenase